MTAVSKQGDVSPFFDTIGEARGGERGNTGRSAIRESHDDGEPVGGKQERRRAGRRGGRRGRAARHTARKAGRRNDATPHGTKSGTGSGTTKQAEANRTEYGMNAQGAGETIRMSSHDVILYCKD